MTLSMQREPTIHFQDNDFIVLSKPSGMTVNRADTTREEITLQDWVEKTFDIVTNPQASQKSTDGTYNPEYEFASRAGIVHRLDKETSGIILVAKHVQSFIGLQKQFKERTIHKAYLALAHGNILPAKGEINVPVGRLPFNRTRFGVVAGGREAVSVYTSLKHYTFKSRQGKEILTLVEVYPKTGRTHQIRVHLKYMNHPLVSDPLYAGRKVGRDDRKILPRLFLHAAKITLQHPLSGEVLHFESPLPEELQAFLDSLVISEKLFNA